MTRTDRDRAERDISGPSEKERIDALEILLRHPLEAGLRADLRTLYLLLTDPKPDTERAA